MATPANKKIKLTNQVPVSARQTRSSTSSTSSKTPVMPIPSIKPSNYDSDHMGDSDEGGFVYESGSDLSLEKEEIEEMVISDEEEEEEKEEKIESITLVDTDDEVLIAPPERSKGKMSSRKLYLLDVETLNGKYKDANDEIIKNFRAEDESVLFNIIYPDLPKGELGLIIMTPELGGYPNTHQSMCYAQDTVSAETEQIIGEIAQLPAEADRSLNGVVEHLINRIVLKKPSPWVTESRYNRKQEIEAGSDEELEEYNIGIDDDIAYEQTPALRAALRTDFEAILKAGFRPGFCRLSELDNIVTVSKKVNSLGVPLRALESWDSLFVKGEVRYLVLLLNFGSKYPVDPDNGTRGEVQFRIGLSPKYKPSRSAIANAFRLHSIDKYTEGDFESVSLSGPLDSLFGDKFQEILLARRSHVNLGWAGAEDFCLNFAKTDKFNTKRFAEVDKIEKALEESYAVPADPLVSKLASERDNYPLLAYTYLVRRFIMCPRFCLICFKTIETEIVALKPFVCESQLCLFQLISLGLGPSLEHEIKTNAPAVDLLVQLAYIAAKDNRLTADLQPQGLSLEVPDMSTPAGSIWKIGDKTVDFDSLEVQARNVGMAALINELPPISEMKSWLECEGLTGLDRDLARSRKLAGMRGNSISNSAWKLLRWVVASNTSYLKLIEEEDELVTGIPKNYRQFRLVVGSPAKEHLLAESIKAVQARNLNAIKYPSIFAFHGSATKNWHSILREGLHFKDTINGRAYGMGVYFARQGELSLGHYSQPSTSNWKGADFGIAKLAAICEIVNIPDEFVSKQPYYVVNNLSYIQCRYLIVQRGVTSNWTAAEVQSTSSDITTSTCATFLTKSLVQDPKTLITLNNNPIGIPDILPKLQAMDQKLSDEVEDLNDSDTEVLNAPPVSATSGSRLKKTASGLISTSPKKKAKVEDTFVPAKDEIIKLIKVLPPPARPNAGASVSIQREMLSMIKEQERDGPSTCGFYLDPERSDDNIFTWIVELILNDQDLPLVKDMKSKGVTSLLMEIRFSENFPLAPPFIRLVYPRLLPFMHGGGGHVTGGGSICMDLLTSNGWSPAYQISAVLLQIRMAISNLDPKPARLDGNWNTPYNMQEAIQGFQRAAATHGWTVPDFGADVLRL